MGRKEQFTVGELTVTGNPVTLGAENIKVLLKDADGDILLATGLTKPTNATAGYAKSCLFIDTDIVTGSPALYENTGTKLSCVFNLIGAISAGEITLAEGSMLIGNNAGVAAAIDGKADTAILIGNATTMAAQTLDGDVTMNNVGTVTIGAKKVLRTMIAAAPGTILGGTKTSLDVSELDNSAAGSVVIGQGAGETCVPHALSGDVTMAISGATTIGADKVSHAMLKDDAVETHNIKDANVTNAKMAPGVFTNTLGARINNATLPVTDRFFTGTMQAAAMVVANASPADGTCRNIVATITQVGGANDVVGNLVIDGTNYSDAVIQETLPLVANGTATGTKAFKTVTGLRSATWARNAGAGSEDTIVIGFGNLLGLPFVNNSAAKFLCAGLGTTLVTDSSKVTVGATIELMTVDLSAGTYNGANDGFCLFSV